MPKQSRHVTRNRQQVVRLVLTQSLGSANVTYREKDRPETPVLRIRLPRSE